MRVTAIRQPFFARKNNTVINNSLNFKPQPLSVDTFCFKGKPLNEQIGIIPSSTPTDLESNIEKELGIEPLKTVIKKFKNGETYVNIAENVRGKHVYLMPTGGKNVNDNLIETYIKADAAKRAGAEKVIAIMPNFDYARQEKRMELGEPITARLNMDLLKTSGVDGIITADLHTPAIEGFASHDMSVTHLESMNLMKKYFEEKGVEDIIVVSPDLGGVKRADKLARALGCDKAIVYKHRQEHNKATAEDLIGDVQGKNCIMFDDIIDTAGTITEASKLLKKNGAKDIYVCATHGLFNGDAMKKLTEAPIKEVIVTDSVQLKEDNPKIKQISMANSVIDAMKTISE